jgi:hypothetical protein
VRRINWPAVCALGFLGGFWVVVVGMVVLR